MSRKKQQRRKRKLPRIRRLTKPGTSPGTVTVSRDAAPPAISVISYTTNQFSEEAVHDLGRVRELLDQHAVTWVDVDGLGDEKILHELSELFGLHRLALEDVVNVHQRAKVEEYGDHLFIVLRMVAKCEPMQTEQLSMFLGKNVLLTLQERTGDCLDPVRQRLRESRGRIRASGADYLAYAVIDAVLDAFFPIVDDYGEQLEWLDDQLASGDPSVFIKTLHDIRADLRILRRAIRPLRDALVRLMPDPHSLISQETQFYLRDCFDHTIQLIDLLDTYSEMCVDLRDFYMSSVNIRLNEVVKVLTIISTIFMPLTFIAGIYGMNFNTRYASNMPELNWPYGYLFALGLMAAVGLGLLGFFWRRGWFYRQDTSSALLDDNGKPNAT